LNVQFFQVPEIKIEKLRSLRNPRSLQRKCVEPFQILPDPSKSFQASGQVSVLFSTDSSRVLGVVAELNTGKPN
jgi:hypothetical protein